MKTEQQSSTTDTGAEETATTVTGEETEAEETAAEEQTLKRDDDMSEIARRHREARDQELREAGVEVAETTGEEELEEEEDDTVGVASDQEDEDQLVDLKVDGEIVQKLQSEVDAEGGIAQMQKKLSGEKRLAKAAEERKALEEKAIAQAAREADIAAREKAVDDRIKALEKRQVIEVAAPADVDVEDLTGNVLEHIYEGNKDEAKEALTKLVTSIQRTTVIEGKPELSEEAVLEKAMYQIDRRDGQAQFQKDYAHLAADKNLFEMVDSETIKVQKEHPDWNPKKIIMEAARIVDEWRLEVLGEDKEPEENAEIRARQDKKRSTKPLPTAKGRKKQQEGFKPRTQADIFAAMKANRSH